MRPAALHQLLSMCLVTQLWHCAGNGGQTAESKDEGEADDEIVDSDPSADALVDVGNGGDTASGVSDAVFDAISDLDATAEVADGVSGLDDTSNVTYQGDATCTPGDAGKLTCCEPSKGGGSICYSAKPALDVATGGCDAGHFDAGGICIENNCNAVGDLLGKSLHESIVKGGQTCSQDSDCTVIEFSTACSEACPIGVAKSVAAAYQAVVAKFDAEICIPNKIGSICDIKGSPNCKTPPTPGCVQGKCSAFKKFPTSDCPLPPPTGATCYDGTWTCPAEQALHPLGSTCITATCENVAAAVQEWITATTEKGGACNSDADCTVYMPSGACASPCALPMTLAAKKALQDGSSEAGLIKTYCKLYFNSVGCAATTTCPMTNTEAINLGAHCDASACKFNAAPAAP